MRPYNVVSCHDPLLLNAHWLQGPLDPDGQARRPRMEQRLRQPERLEEIRRLARDREIVSAPRSIETGNHSFAVAPWRCGRLSARPLSCDGLRSCATPYGPR